MYINTFQVSGERTDKPHIRKFALEIPKSYEKLLISGANSYSKAVPEFIVTVISNCEFNDTITANFIAVDLPTLQQLEIPDNYVFLNTVTCRFGNSSFHKSYAVFMEKN